MAASSQHVYLPRHPQQQAVAQAANPNFIVSYDAVLGNDGITAADSILQHCEADFQNLLASLTGQQNGFDRFSTFMDAKFPASDATALMTDNPFPL